MRSSPPSFELPAVAHTSKPPSPSDLIIDTSNADNRLAKIKASFMGIKGLSLQEFSLEKCSESKFDEIELTGTQATTY